MGAALALIAFLGADDVVAVPSFEEYLVSERLPATLRRADLGSHPDAMRYRGVLRRTDRQRPNFAGHFTIARIGCGASCALLAVVDRQNGHVYFPSELGALHWSMPGGEEPGYSFKANSRLIRACGDPAESGKPACRFYEWTGKSVRLVAQTSWGSPRTQR